jgi:D-serine deaminase-like pyridoxal phosphate-dependent protein
MSAVVSASADTIFTLPTPALVLDSARLRRNVAAMHRRAADLGVGLRPHLKTAKSIDVVRLALSGQPHRITVSTLAEARYALDNGIRDILYAVGIAPAKLDEVVALRSQGADITVVLDSGETARGVGERLDFLEAECPVLIEVDPDGGRAGVAPASADLIAIARALDSHPRTRFRGIMAFAGSSYGGADTAEIARIAEIERRSVVDTADALAAVGIASAIRSVGCTPTATFARHLDGITELRAGVFMFQDLTMESIGVCQPDALALSVVATVIGQRISRGELIIDAGWTSLSSDCGALSASLPTYGQLCNLAGEPIENLTLFALTQEQGLVANPGAGRDWIGSYPVGTRLRVQPNHACAMAAMHSSYHIVEGNAGLIVGRWSKMSSAAAEPVTMSGSGKADA